jgi:hypothetical protein
MLGQNQIIDYWSIAAMLLAPVNGDFGGEYNLILSKHLLIYFKIYEKLK